MSKKAGRIDFVVMRWEWKRRGSGRSEAFIDYIVKIIVSQLITKARFLARERPWTIDRAVLMLLSKTYGGMRNSLKLLWKKATAACWNMSADRQHWYGCISSLTYAEDNNASHDSSVLWVGDLLICGTEKAGLFLVAATGLDNDTLGRHFRNMYIFR